MNSSKHLADSTDASNQRVYLFLRVIEGEGCTDSTADAQSVHQGLCTMMTCADGNAQTVEQGTHIQMMDIANEE